MLADSKMISFISTAQPEKARRFYVDVLGLEFLREEPTAMMLRGNGRLLRIQKVQEVPPPRGAALGWEVSDIEAKVDGLAAAGVEMERYDGIPQDQQGIAVFPNGDRVVWFRDPDGNVLSLTQLA